MAHEKNDMTSAYPPVIISESGLLRPRILLNGWMRIKDVVTQANETTAQADSGGLRWLNAYTISYVLLALAIAVSGYLSWLKISQVDAVCLAGNAFDCGTVLNSVYSEIGGVPIAWLGLATNFVIVGLLVAQNRVGFLREYGTLIVFGVVLFAFIYSVYLVYLQAFVIGAYCQWCLTHEALIGLLFLVWVRQAWVALQK